MNKAADVFSKDELNVSKSGVKVIPVEQVERMPLILASMEEVRSRLDACEDSVRQQGYEDGYAKGLLDGSTELLQLLNEAENYYQANEKNIIDLIIKSISQVLGTDMEKGELVSQMACKALKKIQEPNSVTLIIHPDVLGKVEDKIATYSEKALMVKIVTDNNIRITDCKLDTDFGSIDASLETQLTAIENAFYMNTHE